MRSEFGVRAYLLLLFLNDSMWNINSWTVINCLYSFHISFIIAYQKSIHTFRFCTHPYLYTVEAIAAFYFIFIIALFSFITLYRQYGLLYVCEWILFRYSYDSKFIKNFTLDIHIDFSPFHVSFYGFLSLPILVFSKPYTIMKMTT